MTENCGLVKRDFLLGRFVCLPLPTSKKTMIEVLNEKDFHDFGWVLVSI